MYQIRNNQKPDIYNFLVNSDVHSYHTRQKDSIHKDFCRTKCRQDTMRFQGPDLWNNIPQEIKNVSSFFKFKKMIKHFFIMYN